DRVAACLQSGGGKLRYSICQSPRPQNFVAHHELHRLSVGRRTDKRVDRGCEGDRLPNQRWIWRRSDRRAHLGADHVETFGRENRSHAEIINGPGVKRKLVSERRTLRLSHYAGGGPESNSSPIADNPSSMVDAPGCAEFASGGKILHACGLGPEETVVRITGNPRRAYHCALIIDGLTPGLAVKGTQI